MFTGDGVWVKRIGEKRVRIGVSDFLVKKFHMFFQVEYKKRPGEHFKPGECVIALEALKDVFEVSLPFGGKIVSTNRDVERDTTLLNEKPFEAWLLEAEVESEDVLKNLLTEEEFREHLGKK